jgi:transcriptional regulator with XRE-family HTH domain
MNHPVANSTDKAIGARLRAYRAAAGKTQSQVGEHLGVTFQQIQKYENGRNRISGSRLVVLSEFLKVGVEDILGASGAKHSDDFTAMSNRSVALAIKAMGKLPKHQQTMVAECILLMIRMVGTSRK